jgi:hypothetical protein
MIIGKRRSGGTRHEKLSGNGDTECASPWQEDGPGVMSLCPFRFFPSQELFFFRMLFLDGWRWWNRAAAPGRRREIRAAVRGNWRQLDCFRAREEDN